MLRPLKSVLIALSLSVCANSYPHSSDQTSSPEVPPLSWAATIGNVNEIINLLGNGHDINATDANDWTALMRAVANKQYTATNLLLLRGANPNHQAQEDGTSALLIAVAKGDYGIVSTLFHYDTNPNLSRTDTLMSPLMLATDKGHYAIAKLLLLNGSNPNHTDKDGDTAIDLAKFYNHSALIDLLSQF